MMDILELIAALEVPGSVGVVVLSLLYVYRDAMQRFDEHQEDLLSLLRECLQNRDAGI